MPNATVSLAVRTELLPLAHETTSDISECIVHAAREILIFLYFKKTEVTADRWSRGVRPHDQERSGAPHSLQKLTALNAAFGRSGYALGAAVGGLMGSYFPGYALAFAICLFLMGLVCAAFSVQRTSYRYASITLAIVALVTRANNPWIFAMHRFAEVSIGIAVGLAITALWPESEQPRA